MGQKRSSLSSSAQPQTAESKVSSTVSRIRLVWTHHRSLQYRRVSTNVIREVCDFLGEPPLLLAEQSGFVYLFHPVSHVFSPFFDLTSFLGYATMQNYTFMGRLDVFMTLWNFTSALEEPAYFAVYRSKEVVRFADERNRINCAVIYDRPRNCVYIFGGEPSSSLLASIRSKKAQKFQCATEQFESLSDMQTGRSNFGVCWHTELVYLCGGSDCSIETFDPRCATFAQHSLIDCDPHNDWAFLAAAVRDELFVISNACIWRGRTGQWVKKQRKRAKNKGEGAIGSPVVWGNVLYMADGLGSVGLDLDSGEESVFLIPLPS